MSAAAPCPEAAQLQALLDRRVGDATEFQLQNHLDQCVVCQQTLERLVAQDDDDDVVVKIASQLGGESTVITAALSSAMRQFQDQIGDRTAAPNDSFSMAERTAIDCLVSTDSAVDVGGQLGLYEISQILGQGGMGIVFKGTDPRLRRDVAIKVLSPKLASNPLARARFIREARAQAAVNHPNLVTIYEVSELEEQNLPFLAMELVEGESFLEMIRREESLPVEVVAKLGAEICAGLEAAHNANVIHRDIKPANILIDTRTNAARITDFGLALVLDEVDDRITQTGTVAGTPTYMSPEQIADGDVDHRSDLFSLGTLLYVATTGKSPFEAPTHRKVLDRVLAGDATPIEEHDVKVPAWFASVIRKLHAPDPNQRFQSAAEVRDALKSQARVNLENPMANSLPWKYLTGAATAIACLCLAYFAATRWPSPPEASPGVDVSAATTTKSEATLPTTAADIVDTSGAESTVVTTAGELEQAIQAGATHIVVGCSAKLELASCAIRVPTTIRAARGYSPTISGTAATQAGAALFHVQPGASLTLQQLDITLPENLSGELAHIVEANDAGLRITRCNLSAYSGEGCVQATGSSTVVLMGTRFTAPQRTAVLWRPRAESSVSVVESIATTDVFLTIEAGEKPDASFEAANVTFLCPVVFALRGTDATEAPIRIDARHCVFDTSDNEGEIARRLFKVVSCPGFNSPIQSLKWLRSEIQWTGGENLFALPNRNSVMPLFVEWPSRFCWYPKSMLLWDREWNIPQQQASMKAPIRYSPNRRPHPLRQPALDYGADPTLVGPEAQ